MSRRGQRTDLAERVEIGERWKSGQKDQQIAIEMQRPIATIRKWRRRVQHQGRAGLSSRMGRPASGVLGQYPDEIVHEISKMRRKHPGWGPLTILTEMRKADQFAGKKLPSRSRLAAYLKQEGFAMKCHNPSPRRLSDPIRSGKWMPKGKFVSLGWVALRLSTSAMSSAV
jgi:transposase